MDLKRVAVLRTASDFDRPYSGQATYESLKADVGGSSTAIANLYKAGRPFVDDVVKNWSAWEMGVP
jgi:purine nucleoside permease